MWRRVLFSILLENAWCTTHEVGRRRMPGFSRIVSCPSFISFRNAGPSLHLPTQNSIMYIECRHASLTQIGACACLHCGSSAGHCPLKKLCEKNYTIHRWIFWSGWVLAPHDTRYLVEMRTRSICASQVSGRSERNMTLLKWLLRALSLREWDSHSQKEYAAQTQNGQSRYFCSPCNAFASLETGINIILLNSFPVWRCCSRNSISSMGML